MKNENRIEKSAILKGQTLVNLVENEKAYTVGSGGSANRKITKNSNSTKIEVVGTEVSCVVVFDNNYQLKANTKYTITFDSSTTGFEDKMAIGFHSNEGSYTVATKSVTTNNGKNKIVLSTPSEFGIVGITIGRHGAIPVGSTIQISNMIVLEGEYTDQDIPYFTGMQSVKLPGLTTTGKNLCDNSKNQNIEIELATGYEKIHDSCVCSDYIRINPSDSYIASVVSPSRNSVTYRYYDNNKNYIGTKSTSNAMFVRLRQQNNESPLNATDVKFQLELNSTTTPYEPYQSNTLTVNEPIELRGIGDVRDELDAKTGEVTERIGEIVFDGSSDKEWGRNGSLSDGNYLTSFFTISVSGSKRIIGSVTKKCDKLLVHPDYSHNNDVEGIHQVIDNQISIRVLKTKLSEDSANGFKQWLQSNPITVQYQLVTESTKPVNLSIKDQNNQPQDRMKIYPSGYINTSSSTIPPILELKGITHNNKLNMTTTNGTNNTQLATLDNLALDGIICREGTIVRDSYDVESGLYTKRVFRFTIDEEFVERYRGKWGFNNSTTMTVAYITTTYPKCANANYGITNLLPFMYSTTTRACCVTTNTSNLYITLPKEEAPSQDVDGILDWIKRNGAIEVAYQMATPQIIHMQPNMQPYVSTRPYQGSIESQGNILESSFLDYTSEQSIISPKPLGEGDVLRWEQGSQCYVYENDKEYIPLTDYNQPIGTVLDLEEEDGEQFVENLDGGDIIVDVPFKEKAVYERHLTPYEDKVIYPTQDKLDPTGKIEVDYICGETWQNPNDLSDIRHVGTLREDGQYDVTIRRSGDDEIRLMDGITHVGLDGDGLNPSEFELTFFNSGGVEVGKYGDTSHALENCVLDSKLETGMVYGETMVNLLNPSELSTNSYVTVKDNIVTIKGNGANYAIEAKFPNITTEPNKVYTLCNCNLTDNTTSASANYTVMYRVVEWSGATYKRETTVKNGAKVVTIGADTNNLTVILYVRSANGEAKFTMPMLLEGDYTLYSMDIPYFEGVGSTIVNGFTTASKNLASFGDGLYTYKDINIKAKDGILYINGCYNDNDVYVYCGKTGNWNQGLYNEINLTSGKKYTVSLKVVGGSVDCSNSTLDDYFSFNADGNALQTKLEKGATTYVYYTNTVTQIGSGWFRIRKGVVYNNLAIQVQVEEGTTATEFEPYKGITYILPTPITLNKVGDVADTYDVVSGVEKHNIEVYTPQITSFRHNDNYVGLTLDSATGQTWFSVNDFSNGVNTLGLPYVNVDLCPGTNNSTNTGTIVETYGEAIGQYNGNQFKIVISKSRMKLSEYTVDSINVWLKDNLTLYFVLHQNKKQTIQHTLIPSTTQTTQEPTFILPQPLRSVPNGICDRLYWDENKGHYCIEKRVGEILLDGVPKDGFGYEYNSYAQGTNTCRFFITNTSSTRTLAISRDILTIISNRLESVTYIQEYNGYKGIASYGESYINFSVRLASSDLETRDNAGVKKYFVNNPTTVYYPLMYPQIIDLPHLNKKLTLPTQPDTLPIGYKVEYAKGNPQLGLTIPYKQLNYPSRPQNIDFKMDIADYVLTWDDVKEARQYNIILNDRTIATVKEPQWNSGEEMYGYIMVEAQNELAENLSEELYIKTVPNAPAQLTVAHNPMTDYYDFEISFIKTSAIAEYYTVQYRIDGGEWVYKTIQSDEIDPNSKVLWRFSVYEISEQIEVWATATNEIGTNDILPIATYYMSPTPQWTYRINSKELFVRWMDESPYDTQYKLRYQYKSDGIFRYAYFEGDKQEIGKLYEALIPLADDEEVAIALCIISEKENLYTKPIRASKELDPNIKPPKNFNYHWLARGLIEFYWEDNYDVDVEYEAIVEHRLTSGNNEWITDTRIFSATDTEGTGTVYRLSYQMEDLEEIRVKVRMKWAMNETEWSESLTTVFIPVEGNPPQWIRRTQTQEGLLVEWEAQEYVDSYHVYVMSNGEELQHLETMDNFIYVDLDYSNPIDIEIYEATRFSGGIQSDPSDKMCFRPTMDKQQMIYNVVTPDTLTYEIEVDTIQKGIKERQLMHHINTTPNVKDKQPMDVTIKSPFTLSYHPLRLDVHQAGSKYYGDTELHIKTLNVKSRDAIEVLSFERITDQYGVDFTVYTPSASKYPITLEVNRVRIVCFGDSLTSGHPGFWAETGTGDPQHCYEYWLDRRLKGQYEIINKGYGSDTTDRMLARFDRDVLANNPQYCIIQGGTNDLYWDLQPPLYGDI